ncbi:MAG: CarD family transcriptional regulator [Ruminococcus sp.]|nr:CarD family transcriptional regulator [Ruminococcus sp.]
MFSKGELIVYGSSGVYRVDEVGPIDIKGCEDKQYYTMTPVFGTGTSYVPVDTKVFMRKVMDKARAEDLIDRIPDIEESQFNERNPKAIKEHYSASMKSHDLSEMLSMIKAIYAKGERCRSSNKKLSRIEQQYMNQAEDLVYGEFAVALGIPRESVLGYIRERLSGRENGPAES